MFLLVTLGNRKKTSSVKNNIVNKKKCKIGKKIR